MQPGPSRHPLLSSGDSQSSAQPGSHRPGVPPTENDTQDLHQTPSGDGRRSSETETEGSSADSSVVQGGLHSRTGSLSHAVLYTDSNDFPQLFHGSAFASEYSNPVSPVEPHASKRRITITTTGNTRGSDLGRGGGSRQKASGLSLHRDQGSVKKAAVASPSGTSERQQQQQLTRRAVQHIPYDEAVMESKHGSGAVHSRDSGSRANSSRANTESESAGSRDPSSHSEEGASRRREDSTRYTRASASRGGTSHQQEESRSRNGAGSLLPSPQSTFLPASSSGRRGSLSLSPRSAEGWERDGSASSLRSSRQSSRKHGNGGRDAANRQQRHARRGSDAGDSSSSWRLGRRQPYGADASYEEENNRSANPFLAREDGQARGGGGQTDRQGKASATHKEKAHKQRAKRREEMRRKTEKTMDPWLYESIPLSFVMRHLKRLSFRMNLLREFVVFTVLLILFCFYTEYHSTDIEQGFFASLGIREQYGRQEFPSTGRQVDVFRQEEQNEFGLWLRLDNYFHAINGPLDYLDFLHDIVVGGGDAPARGTSPPPVPVKDGETVLNYGDVQSNPSRSSARSFKAFTAHGGSPFQTPQQQRSQYFCGALRMRTIRVRNGTGTIQASLYRQRKSPTGQALYVPEDIYASSHGSKHEDVSQLCPAVVHPLPAFATDNPVGANGSVLLYKYVACDSVPYHAGRIKGIHGSYHCGGHVVDIPFTASTADAQRIVAAMAMPSCRFLDAQATRLAVTELFVYLPSIDQWLSVKFRSEVTAAGHFDNSIAVRAFRVYTDAAMRGQLAFTCVTLVVVVCVFAMMLYKVVMLLRTDNLLASRTYISGDAHTGWRPIVTVLCTLWPYLDAAFVVAALVSFAYFFRWVVVSKKELPAIRASLVGADTATAAGVTGTGVYPAALDEVQQLYEHSHVAAVVALAALLVRGIYFCHFFVVTRVLAIDMIGVCAPRVTAIAAGFLVTLLGYALAGWAVFGSTVETFSTIGDAITTLLQMFTGELFFVPSELVEQVTLGDSQLNESFVFFFFWSYFALVMSIAVCLVLALTSLAYQELTRKVYILSGDGAYVARQLRVWRSRLAWPSLKLTLASLVGLRDPVWCHEQLLACLRRTREEREMQRITTAVEAKLEHLRAEVACASPLPSRQHQHHRDAAAAGGDTNSASAHALASTGGKGTTSAKLEVLLGQSSGTRDGGGSLVTGTSSTTAETLVESLSALLYGISADKPDPGAGTASTRSEMPTGTTPTTAAAGAPSLGDARHRRQRGERKASDPRLGNEALLHRARSGSMTTEELRHILTADLVNKARSRRGASATPGDSGSDSGTEDSSDDLFPGDSDTLTYFTLTDILPAWLFNKCGGESYFVALWIDLVADYAEMMSRTAPGEKQAFMRAVGAATQAQVGSQLARVEQLDATITQLEGHMSNIIASVQAFSEAMATVASQDHQP